MIHNSLTIYGAGNLGQKTVTPYRQNFPNAVIYGITRTTANHKVLNHLSINPRIKGDTITKTANLIVAVPPKEDYIETLNEALKHWDRTGKLLLISSTRVYTESNGAEVFEESAVNSDSVLCQAEKIVLDSGGMILRLAGLYDNFRGPHKYVETHKKLPGSPDSFLNLIHTQDAADLAVQCILFGTSKNIYLGCDDHPLRRREFVELLYGPSHDIVFSESDELGKRCNNEWTRKQLNWQPKFRTLTI